MPWGDDYFPLRGGLGQCKLLKINSRLPDELQFNTAGELPHVRVGHRQALYLEKAVPERERLFLCPWEDDYHPWLAPS